MWLRDGGRVAGFGLEGLRDRAHTCRGACSDPGYVRASYPRKSQKVRNTNPLRRPIVGAAYSSVDQTRRPARSGVYLPGRVFRPRLRPRIVSPEIIPVPAKPPMASVCCAYRIADLARRPAQSGAFRRVCALRPALSQCTGAPEMNPPPYGLSAAIKVKKLILPNIAIPRIIDRGLGIFRKWNNLLGIYLKIPRKAFKSGDYYGPQAPSAPSTI